MNFIQYLTVMAIGTAGAWIAWVITLFTIDPTETSIIGFLFFYLTLLIALVGTLAIIGTALRVLFKRTEVISRQVFVAFRHSILFGILIIGSLILTSFDVLRWWSVLLFIFLIAGVELFFLTAKPPRPKVE